MKLWDKRGVAAVEFAVILPLLLILLFGIVEFSLILYDKAIITNASREGTRAGIVQAPRLTDSEIEFVVKNYCRNHVISFGDNDTIGVTISREGLDFGDDLTVTVGYDYYFLILPSFVTSLVNPIYLSATTVMRME